MNQSPLRGWHLNLEDSSIWWTNRPEGIGAYHHMRSMQFPSSGQSKAMNILKVLRVRYIAIGNRMKEERHATILWYNNSIWNSGRIPSFLFNKQYKDSISGPINPIATLGVTQSSQYIIKKHEESCQTEFKHTLGLLRAAAPSLTNLPIGWISKLLLMIRLPTEQTFLSLIHKLLFVLEISNAVFFSSERASLVKPRVSSSPTPQNYIISSTPVTDIISYQTRSLP